MFEIQNAASFGRRRFCLCWCLRIASRQLACLVQAIGLEGSDRRRTSRLLRSCAPAPRLMEVL